MLRASSQSAGVRVNLASIVDANMPAGPAGGTEILAFTRAVVGRTDDLLFARAALRAELGDAGAAAIAGTVGNFEMMNRILDATGVPTPGSLRDLETRLRS